MNPQVDTALENILSIDPVAEAEKLADLMEVDGTDRDSLMLGLCLTANQIKRDALKDRGDIHFGATFTEACAIAEDIGFKLILSHEFTADDNYNGFPRENEKTWTETLNFYWLDGMLLMLESYNGNSLNSGKVYFNWIANEGVSAFFPTSSGGCDQNEAGQWVFSGDRDVRDGLRHIVNRLHATGTLLPKWHKSPFVWFLSYMDTRKDENGQKSYDYEAINAARFAQFPADVQAAIGNINRR